mmetsp:Transcript_5534/g.13996  ORF Transcript_5534/g.13996 Transcript_5534/m.13996 type:complete len:110 (+) Transcript_5534:888-1217(+)
MRVAYTSQMYTGFLMRAWLLLLLASHFSVYLSSVHTQTHTLSLLLAVICHDDDIWDQRGLCTCCVGWSVAGWLVVRAGSHASVRLLSRVSLPLGSVAVFSHNQCHCVLD